MDPMTIAMAAQAGGGLLKGLFSFLGGNQQAAMEKAKARQANDEASVNAQIALQQGNEKAASAATQAAANGGGLVGSSMGVIQQASNNAYFNARAQVYRGQVEANNYLYQAKVDKANGINGLISSVTGTAGQMAGDVADNQFRQSILKSTQTSAGDGEMASDAEFAGLF